MVNYRQDNAPVEGEVGERVALIAETMQNSELLARRSALATIPTTLTCSVFTHSVSLLTCPFNRHTVLDNVCPDLFIGQTLR